MKFTHLYLDTHQYTLQIPRRQRKREEYYLDGGACGQGLGPNV